MHTRRALYSYYTPCGKRCGKAQSATPCKKHKSSPYNGFHLLSDDLVLSIFISLARHATTPTDIINPILTCKRFHAIEMHPLLLANINASAMGAKAGVWCDGYYQFLKRCADAGNTEACFTLGMIQFYCLQDRAAGIYLMAKAAMASHAHATHSLAVIQFNGSGRDKKGRDLKAGILLSMKAASLGHVDAMRELSHCLQEGYGIQRNYVEARRLLLEANAREAAAAVACSPRALIQMALHFHTVKPSSKRGNDGDVDDDDAKMLLRHSCSLLSDYGCNVRPAETHIANKFLVEWFAMHPPPCELRLCSHGNCGRLETRTHEFKRCSACGIVNYCSRACQALHWKTVHKAECHLLSYFLKTMKFEKCH